MNRAVLSVFFHYLLFSFAVSAQAPDHSLSGPPLAALADPDPMGGGGQAEYSAERGNAFTRVVTGVTVSTLGIGVDAGTNLGPRLDLRLFGNYTNITHSFSRSGFRIELNVGLANAGAMADFYPLHRFPLRFSPGFLYLNQNRIAASLHARPGATFTINNVEYASETADPVHGNGRLTLGGGGFMVTTGLGHIVSHTRKRLTFPLEAGVAFIHTPVVQFNLLGHVCGVNQPGICQPASQFPTFAENLATQVASWNRRVSPFHIYPVLEGGVAYSFELRGRGIR
jgi:hypothetical protein